MCVLAQKCLCGAHSILIFGLGGSDHRPYTFSSLCVCVCMKRKEEWHSCVAYPSTLSLTLCVQNGGLWGWEQHFEDIITNSIGTMIVHFATLLPSPWPFLRVVLVILFLWFSIIFSFANFIAVFSTRHDYYQVQIAICMCSYQNLVLVDFYLAVSTRIARFFQYTYSNWHNYLSIMTACMDVVCV